MKLKLTPEDVDWLEEWESSLSTSIPDLIHDWRVLAERVRELENAVAAVLPYLPRIDDGVAAKFSEHVRVTMRLREVLNKGKPDDNSLRSPQHKPTSGVPD